ncbi:hypothetical protein TgHK011_006887 [Trichoderma gracile]|nr:hypothetical protein TgHK011_006887 [Trichoderma gracile]
MGPGEIPVNHLTHLNIAFGYITPDFRITNMDGLSPDIYRDVGDVKARNPNLKLLIALGGWKFSDPGPWQAVFSTMVSTQANRAAFIQNALGFLEEYGYDGIDWEYPGAEDRGGSTKDGENYVALLKELRAAIRATGRDYIVTFTAPTSYWYLRHFDVANMVAHVDWVNLMSYDLHGVWDGNNPIGEQILAHTNLTEIDLSLDLFWRAGARERQALARTRRESSLSRRSPTYFAGLNTVASFEPYYQIQYQVSTRNSTVTGDFSSSAVPFSGRLETRILSDFGDSTLEFPISKGASLTRGTNKIHVPSTNVVYGTGASGGIISLSTITTFGLKSQLTLGGSSSLGIDLPDMSVTYNTITEFKFSSEGQGNAESTCVDYDTATVAYQSQNHTQLLRWDGEDIAEVAQDSQVPEDGKICYRKPGNESSEGQAEMPGWEYGQGVAVQASSYFLNNEVRNLFNQQTPKFNCHSCMSCGRASGGDTEGEEEEEEEVCCGCDSLEYLFPDYTDFNPLLDSAEDSPSWKSSLVFGFGEHDNERGEGLQKRIPGIATMSPKSVKICGIDSSPSSDYFYPAFPASARNPWDGIQQGRWDSISRYWGNSSADCVDWTAAQLTVADADRTPVGVFRSKYQTEHVFEGQMISIFFSSWLDQGTFPHQNPPVTNPQPKMPCAVTQEYITDFYRGAPWELDGQKQPFVQLMLAELGNQNTLDRLTIFKARPNRKKGNLFSQIQTVSRRSYHRMTAQQQLQSVKELGLVFSYMNNAIIWTKFCDTYEALYELLGKFDTWYAARGAGVAIPSLQDEWRVFTRAVLHSMGLNAQRSLDWMYRNRKIPRTSRASAVFNGIWAINMRINKPSLVIQGRCPNLP